MALWQSTYFVVPKSGNYTLFEGINLESFMEEGFFDDELLWSNIDFDPNNFEILKDVLKKGESWSKNITLFGREDDNCFEVLTAGNIIKSVSFRINFTSDYKEILQGITDFCTKYNLMVVDENLNVFEPDFFKIVENIKNSKTYKKYALFVDKEKN